MAEPEAMEVSGGEEPQQEQAKGSSDASAAEEAAPDPAKETAGKPELADGEEGEDDEDEEDGKDKKKKKKKKKKKSEKERKSHRRKREKEEGEQEGKEERPDTEAAAGAEEANGKEEEEKEEEGGGSGKKRERGSAEKDRERYRRRRSPSPPRRRHRSRSRSPPRRRVGYGRSRRSPTPPRIRERRREVCRRSPSRSRSRDLRSRRRSRSRSDSRDRRSRRRRSSRSRSRSRGRDRKRRSRSSSGGGSDGERKKEKAATGAEAAAAEEEPEEELEPGVVDVGREAAIKGAIPTIAELIKRDPKLGVVGALQKVEQEKQMRSLNEQVRAQAQALMQANLNGAQQAAAMGLDTSTPSPALTKPARELFVGNLPPGTLAPQLSAFLGAAMLQASLIKAGPGSPVVNVWLAPDGRFAFVEFRSAEEATAALALNNLSVGGGVAQLRVGRPKEYQPSYLALKDTPLNVHSVSFPVNGVPLPSMGAANAAGPVILPGAAVMPGAATAAGVAAAMGSPYLMLMNLPVILGELDVKELLKPFGELRSFNLLKDQAGQSKGIAIFELASRAEAQVCMKGLNGLEIGDKRLAIQEIPVAQANMLLRPVAPTLEGEGAGLSTVIRLANMLTAEMDAGELGEIKDEVADECRKYGNLVEVVCGTPEAGSFIFVQFGDARASQRALRKLHGRSFDERSVVAQYYPLEAFQIGDYGAEVLVEEGAGEKEGNGEGEEQLEGGNGGGGGATAVAEGEEEGEGGGGTGEEEEGEEEEAGAPAAPVAPVEEDLD